MILFSQVLEAIPFFIIFVNQPLCLGTIFPVLCSTLTNGGKQFHFCMQMYLDIEEGFNMTVLKLSKKLEEHGILVMLQSASRSSSKITCLFSDTSKRKL